MSARCRKLFICTLGTSIAQGCPSLNVCSRENHPFSDGAPRLAEEIAERLGRYAGGPGAAERLKNLSAELNSLGRLGLEAPDSVTLLATDTAEGQACGEAVKTALLVAFGLEEAAVRLLCVPSLQVHRATELRRRGLPFLIRMLIEEIQNGRKAGFSQVVLNPTGGYKGIVPFVSVIGMLYGLTVVYSFEFSEVLIELPPLPVSFDLLRFQRARPALEEIAKRGSLAKEEYWRRIQDFQPPEEAQFACYVEETGDGQVSLSPLAGALYEVSSTGPSKVRISPNVLKEILRFNGLKRYRFELLASRIADPLWRSCHLHGFEGTDLEVYKPGNVPERLAGITTPDAFFLCEYFAEHDSYELELPSKRASHYDLTKFASFSPGSSDADLDGLVGCGIAGTQPADTGEQITGEHLAQAGVSEHLNRELKKLHRIAEERGKENIRLREEILNLRAELRRKA